MSALSILVVDIGGSHVKIYPGCEEKRVKFDSGKTLSPPEFVRRTKEACGDWRANRISIGYPGRVVGGRIVTEPVNLGDGWIGFDFEAAFALPVRVLNDAALQALGSYEGGRMLFIGLGTAVGSTLITENVIVPMEFGEFHSEDGTMYRELLGKEGLEKLGLAKWREIVLDLLSLARRALFPDEIVIGGGLVDELDELPEGTRRGDNQHAFRGGCRLWESLDLQQGKPSNRWLLA